MTRDESLEFSFSSLNDTDRIVVTTNLNQTLAIIDSTEPIASVLGALAQHSSGWEVPRTGVPVAKLRLNFYQGDRFLGNVGVGKSFLTTHQYGSFFSKPSDEAEYARLLDIMGYQP